MKGKFARTWAVGADHLPLELEGRNLDVVGLGIEAIGCWWKMGQHVAEGLWGSEILHPVFILGLEWEKSGKVPLSRKDAYFQHSENWLDKFNNDGAPCHWYFQSGPQFSEMNEWITAPSDRVYKSKKPYAASWSYIPLRQITKLDVVASDEREGSQDTGSWSWHAVPFLISTLLLQSPPPPSRFPPLNSQMLQGEMASSSCPCPGTLLFHQEPQASLLHAPVIFQLFSILIKQNHFTTDCPS